MEGAAAAQKEEKIKKMVEDIFAKFDADNSGGIDLEEARPIFIEELKKTGATKLKVDENVLNEYFQKADLNKDGVISKEEAELFIGTYLLH